MKRILAALVALVLLMAAALWWCVGLLVEIAEQIEGGQW